MADNFHPQELKDIRRELMGFLIEEEQLDKELKLLEDGEDLVIFFEDAHHEAKERDEVIDFFEEANTDEDIDAFLRDAELDSNDVDIFKNHVK